MTAMTTRLATAAAAAIVIATGCAESPDVTPPGGEAGEALVQELAGKPAELVETGRRWLTIDADAVDTAREVLGRGATGTAEPLEVRDGIALFEVDARDLRALSEAMHEEHGRCGGFMLHDALEDGRDALRVPARDAIAASFAPSYMLDQAATVQAILPALDQASLLATIQQLSGLQTRYYTSATGVAVSSQLRDKWIGYANGRTDVQVALFAHTGFPQQSVIATIPGTERPDEVIVIGGHLDSISSGATAPGADDDASGVATLSEVLRVLLAKNFRPKRTLKFMAYAAEEVGLRGSKSIVADAQAKQMNVVGVLQLDMTNYKGSPSDIYLIQDFTNAAQNMFLGKLIDTYVGATWSTDQCGYGCSDHASWHNAGYPASMPAEARFADTNPSLHTPNDTLAMSGNNAAHAIKFARLAAAFAIEMAKSSNTPPAVSITEPAAGATFGSKAKVTLAGTATDTEDGALDDRLAWSSSLDGDLGTGATLSVTLSPGMHVITAKVTDSAGAATAATASIEITVGGKGDGDGDGSGAGGCAASRGGGPGAALVALAALAAIVVPARRRRRQRQR
jgi:leucyl aminopeptidase